LYRLPKEAEWEYACRGGPLSDKLESAFDFYFQKPTNLLLPEQANFNHLKVACKVGNYQPNPLGLYDMHGNVEEWCDDGAQAADGSSRRVIRGGGWFHDAGTCRAAHRFMHPPSFRVNIIGLRLARVPAEGKGFVPLFNGKDLTGWTPAPQSENAWFVDKGGILTGQTGPDGAPAGLISQRGDFTDFHLRAEVMVNVGDGGLQFRFPRNKSEPPAYHAHVATRGQWQTGGLSRQSVPLALACPIYPLKTVPNAVVPANTWFTLEVVAVGDHLQLRVEGVTTADVRDPPGARAGHIVLQVVYKGSMIKFRKIEIKELTPASVNRDPDDPGGLKRHEGFVEIAKKGDVDVLFLGDSITDAWRGGAAKPTWEKYFVPAKAANFGISGDRTQHVLWRIKHGELDGIKPKVAVLMIGTNNIGSDSAAQIAEGIAAIVKTIRDKSPSTKVLLLAVFPRGEKAGNPGRTKIAEINKTIAKLDDGSHVRYVDIGPKFLEKDGSLTKEIMPDFLHLSAKGYEIWGDAINPTVQEMLGAKK
jgi:lysophospholipase L1-like esterase